MRIRTREAERPPRGALRTQRQQTLAHPEHIGPYRIERRLGEGGMALVYLAHQAEPVRRTVALKVLKPGMCSPEVLARFQLERQTLAALEHPHVAKVFDAGTSEDGTTYLAMERVDGTDVITYCREHRLSLEERLLLFIDICNAVHHVHMKGMLHRDVKPTNVLVSEGEHGPVPKLIDFGLSRSLKPSSDDLLLTQHGQVIGTPAYMSPEQVAGRDLDTRSDIYALGVLLYELITGSLPFDVDLERPGALGEVQDAITHRDPTVPSRRAQSHPDARALAQERKSEVRRLVRRVRGELDWITMCALAKDREQRYRSACEFGSDVRRFLQREPILAASPTATYRLKKFVARHRVVAALAVTLLLGLGGGFFLSTRLYLEATSDRLESEQRVEQTQGRLNEVETEIASAHQANLFLQQLVAAIEAEDASVDEVVSKLREASANLDAFERVRPDEGPQWREKLAKRFQAAGVTADAEPHLRKAFESRRRRLGRNHPRTLQTAAELASVVGSLGKNEEAQKLLLETVDFWADSPEPVFDDSEVFLAGVDGGALGAEEFLPRGRPTNPEAVGGKNAPMPPVPQVALKQLPVDSVFCFRVETDDELVRVICQNAFGITQALTDQKHFELAEETLSEMRRRLHTDRKDHQMAWQESTYRLGELWLDHDRVEEAEELFHELVAAIDEDEQPLASVVAKAGLARSQIKRGLTGPGKESLRRLAPTLRLSFPEEHEFVQRLESALLGTLDDAGDADSTDGP